MQTGCRQGTSIKAIKSNAKREQIFGFSFEVYKGCNLDLKGGRITTAKRANDGGIADGGDDCMLTLNLDEPTVDGTLVPIIF
jgi:hypothetical protein